MRVVLNSSIVYTEEHFSPSLEYLSKTDSCFYRQLHTDYYTRRASLDRARVCLSAINIYFMNGQYIPQNDTKKFMQLI